MWIPVNEIIWALVIVGGMVLLVEFCCECAQGKRELKKAKEREKEAKRAADKQL